MKKEVNKKLDQLNDSKTKLKNGTPILALQHGEEEANLRKVSFNFKYGKNSIADPMLLLIKGVINWSARNNVKMLPGYEEKESSLCQNCDSESCEGCEYERQKNIIPREILLSNTDSTFNDDL